MGYGKGFFDRIADGKGLTINKSEWVSSGGKSGSSGATNVNGSSNSTDPSNDIDWDDGWAKVESEERKKKMSTNKCIYGLSKNGKLYVCQDDCQTIIDATQVAQVYWDCNYSNLYVVYLNGNKVEIKYKDNYTMRELKEKDHNAIQKIHNKIIRDNF